MRRCQRGSALIMVLLALAVISLLAVAVSRQGRSAAAISGAARQGIQAHQAAEAAIAIGEAAVLAGWTQGEPLVSALGPYTLVTMVDLENDRLDLNSVEESDLRALLGPVAGTERAALAAAAIIDWRDEDDRSRPGGAEASDYQRLGLPPPRNGPFLSLFELDGVLGIDEDMLGVLRPMVTVQAEEPRDPAADDEVAEEDGLDRDVILRARQGRPAAQPPARPQREPDERRDEQQSDDDELADDLSEGSTYRVLGFAFRGEERVAGLMVTIKEGDGDFASGEGYSLVDRGFVGDGYRLDALAQSLDGTFLPPDEPRARLVDR